jgi:putative heme iron utilization protein
MVSNIDVCELKRQVTAAILDTLQTRPALTYQQVADQYKVCRKTVFNIAKENKIRRPTGPKPRYLTEAD